MIVSNQTTHTHTHTSGVELSIIDANKNGADDVQFMIPCDLDYKVVNHVDDSHFTLSVLFVRLILLSFLLLLYIHTHNGAEKCSS